MLRTFKAVRGGFSLIEVIMATAVLLVGFIGIIQVVTIGSEALDTARKRHVAHQLVSAEIEKLRAGTWSAIATLPATCSITVSSSGAVSGDTTRFALSNQTSTPSDDNTELCALARGFTCSMTRVLLRPAAASAGTVTFLKVVYTVSWKSNTGRAHTHSVGTYLGRDGLHLSYQQS